MSVLAAFVNEESMYLFSRGRAEVLVSLQQTFTESGLIRCWLHSRKGHLTLQEEMYELEAYSFTKQRISVELYLQHRSQMVCEEQTADT